MAVLTTTGTVAIDEVAEDWARLLELREQIAELQAEAKIHEQAVKDVLGDAEGATIGGVLVATNREYERVTIPLAKARGLLAERTIKKLAVVTHYRSLRVVKGGAARRGE